MLTKYKELLGLLESGEFFLKYSSPIVFSIGLCTIIKWEYPDDSKDLIADMNNFNNLYTKHSWADTRFFFRPIFLGCDSKDSVSTLKRINFLKQLIDHHESKIITNEKEI